MYQIVVLVSGKGSNLNNLIQETRRGILKEVRIVQVLADRDCQGLALAAQNGIPAVRVSRGRTLGAELLALLPEAIDLIVAAGFLSLIPKRVCERFSGRMINLHPSLLPKYGGKGMWGDHIHRAVLAHQERETGVTVHFLTSGLDEGGIIAQERIGVSPEETLETLRQKIAKTEQYLLPKTIFQLLTQKFMNQKSVLISVYDKTGLLPLAQTLAACGYTIISTGGTAAYLQEEGIAVREVSDLTQFPEILEGRVKTLHPTIHAGILAKRDSSVHKETLLRYNIPAIDMVVVNLYPFVAGLSSGRGQEEMLALIDIGGPCMLRAAAKNFQDVLVVSDEEDYGWLIEKLRAGAVIDKAERQKLAAKVFQWTAAYDGAIAHYLGGQEAAFPEIYTLRYKKKEDLRYGENPHQKAAFYEDMQCRGLFSDMEQLHGKVLSFNNFRDMELAWKVVSAFSDRVLCCAVKHMTPCGVAGGQSVAEAFAGAYACDSVSVFGGIVAFNACVDAATAGLMQDIFLEIIMAPDFTQEALEILRQKKNLRLMRIHTPLCDGYHRVSVDGGLLVQEADRAFSQDMRVVTDQQPTPAQWEAMLFGQKVVKFVKSNAIVVADKRRTWGIGAGQVNRIWAAEQAVARALEQQPERSELVLASDAFFPFSDVVALCAGKGIGAIIQPGGALRDKESIEKANAHNIAMVFTGMRHFVH